MQLRKPDAHGLFRDDARGLLQDLKHISKEKRRVILASLKGMLMVAKMQQDEDKADQKGA